MLKWFAKYNKILLVVFGVALMISFTVGTVALDSFFDRMMNLVQYGSVSSPGSQIGLLESGAITTGDEQEAYIDHQILSPIVGSLNPILPQALFGEEQLNWAITLQEARNMGIWASDAEVMNLLAMVGIRDDDTMRQLRERVGGDEQRIYEAVRHFLMIDKYRRLASGAGIQPTGEGATTELQQRLINLQQGAQMVQLAQQSMMQSRNPMAFFQAQQLMQQANMLFLVANGAPRTSLPALERLVTDQSSELAGQFVLVNSAIYLDQVGEPTDEQIQKLYDQYKDTLPGRGEPYPFGYKLPERVKLEAVTIPINPIREKMRPDVEVDIAAAMAFYRENQQQMVKRDEFGNPTNQKLSFEEARPQIIERLIDERAGDQAMQLAQEVRARLNAPLADLTKQAGYFVLPEDFQNTSMRVIADDIKQQTGIELQLAAGQLASQWQNLRELVQVPNLGMSVIAATPQVTFVQYVASARELEPDTDNPLVARRLQVNVPSEVMQSPDGSLSVFRITDASAEHSPTLEEARPQVVADAKKLAAFDMLKTQQSQWLERALTEGLTPLAASIDTEPITFPTLNRVGAQVPGLGRNEQFAEVAYALADKLDTPGSLTDIPAEQRVGGAMLDRELSLAIIELTDFMPISRRRYLAMVDRPEGVAMANLMIESNLPDPLSLESTLKRSAFQYDAGREPGVEDDPDFAPSDRP